MAKSKQSASKIIKQIEEPNKKKRQREDTSSEKKKEEKKTKKASKTYKNTSPSKKTTTKTTSPGATRGPKKQIQTASKPSTPLDPNSYQYIFYKLEENGIIIDIEVIKFLFKTRKEGKELKEIKEIIEKLENIEKIEQVKNYASLSPKFIYKIYYNDNTNKKIEDIKPISEDKSFYIVKNDLGNYNNIKELFDKEADIATLKQFSNPKEKNNDDRFEWLLKHKRKLMELERIDTEDKEINTKTNPHVQRNLVIKDENGKYHKFTYYYSKNMDRFIFCTKKEINSKNKKQTIKYISYLLKIKDIYNEIKQEKEYKEYKKNENNSNIEKEKQKELDEEKEEKQDESSSSSDNIKNQKKSNEKSEKKKKQITNKKENNIIIEENKKEKEENNHIVIEKKSFIIPLSNNNNNNNNDENMEVALKFAKQRVEKSLQLINSPKFKSIDKLNVNLTEIDNIMLKLEELYLKNRELVVDY